jgi:hypothetical protein
MVQASLGMTPVQYEEVIEVVPQEQKIKKKIQVEQDWEDRMFIRIPVQSDRHGPSELENWCREHYKQPRYLGPWFKVSGFIVLDEKTYVHWKLCE